MSHPVYALNLFNVRDKAEYMAYSRRSAHEVGQSQVSISGAVVALER